MAVTLHSLPLFVRLEGRPVILVGRGKAADAKQRLLERAGAIVVNEAKAAALAIVVDDEAAVMRLKARGVLVNAVDRPELCDFTLPAVVDRDPVIVAIGTGGVSAGLAAALRQRLETLLPTTLGQLARDLLAARRVLRDLYPDQAERRMALSAALAAGGAIDPLGTAADVPTWLMAGRNDAIARAEIVRIRLRTADPDDLTLREARALADADRVTHRHGVPPAILDRGRADAPRIETAETPVDVGAGLTVDVAMG